MNSFRKEERLCSQKLLDDLVRSGKRIHADPILSYFKIRSGSGEALQVAFSVPKKFHKKAVDRNRIKRLMRESYRLNKSNLLKMCMEKQISCTALFVYNKPVSTDFQEVQSKIILTLDRFIKEIAGRH